MGARNVSAVFAMYPELAPVPKLLLVWMALKSLDSQGKDGRPPRVYFDGEESLIAAVGRSRSQVYAGLKVLRDDARAVEVLQAGRLKFRAVYKLRLDPLEKASETPPSVRETGPKSVRKTGRNRVRESGIEGPENRTPKKYVGGTEESRGGNNSPNPAISPAQDAPVDNPEIDAMDPGQRNQLLIARHGTRVHTVLAEHGAQHPDCADPVRHLLITPTLTVIPGGKTA